jgi:hypothetical protein
MNFPHPTRVRPVHKGPGMASAPTALTTPITTLAADPLVARTATPPSGEDQPRDHVRPTHVADTGGVDQP